MQNKGKAAHALQLYQKACEAFQCALVESPEDEFIRSSLKASRVAVKQSRDGHYDLADFFARNCRAPIPACVDFIGPVEIRRKPSVDGRARGLFATKSLEPGDLLIVSNPLAAGRQNQNAGTFEVTEMEFPEELVTELVARIGWSNLQSLRFSYLASDDIPSMDLFRFGSEYIPPGGVREGMVLDVNYIHDVASRHMLHYVEMKGEAGGTSEVAGLWMLPAFAKHSCAPNCQHSLVGETLFYRASRHIEEGEELSILYFSGSYDYVTYRRECSQNWMFKCTCERCLYEETLLPQLSRIHEGMDDLQRRHLEAVSVDSVRRGELGLSHACDQVETLIKSLGTNISPKQERWIRASFYPVYLGKMAAQMASPGVIWTNFLRGLVEAQASVDVTYSVLRDAAWLLSILEQDCPTYRDALDQVRVIYRAYYGKIPEALLHKLININTPDCFRP